MSKIRIRAEAGSLFEGATAEDVARAFGAPPAPSVLHLYAPVPLEDHFKLFRDLEVKKARRAILMRVPFLQAVLERRDVNS